MKNELGTLVYSSEDNGIYVSRNWRIVLIKKILSREKKGGFNLKFGYVIFWDCILIKGFCKVNKRGYYRSLGFCYLF